MELDKQKGSRRIRSRTAKGDNISEKEPNERTDANER
jgi:hypothetical protein